MGEGLSRAQRLCRRKDFGRTYSAGTKRHGSFYVVFALRNGLPVTRLGITATRKVGGAVVRNRMKRIVREIFRRQVVPDGYDVVVNVRHEATAAAFAALSADLAALLARVERPR